MKRGEEMRVAFLTPFLSHRGGGISTSVLRLSQTLASQHGVVIDVVSVEKECPAAELKTWLPLQPIALRPRGPGAFGFSPSLTSQLIALQPHIVHCHGLWTYSSLACLRWSHLTGRPFIVTPHGMLDSWALRNSRWKKRLAQLLFQQRHLRAAGCVHALCSPEAQSVRALGLLNPLCVIPNGIDLPTAAHHARPGWAATIPTNHKVLLFLGRLHPKKGVANLLRAWKSASANAEQWHLAIAGWDDGGHETHLRTVASELALERVHFIGAQLDEAKSATFAHADGFILPSLSEGLPMTILEAWAYRKPVVMTAECNLPEGFDAGAAIQITSDTHGIADGLRQLTALTDGDRDQIGMRGHRLVEERFSWTGVARQMHSVYEWVIAGRDAPPPPTLRV